MFRERERRKKRGREREWELSETNLPVVATRNSCWISQCAQCAHVTGCWQRKSISRSAHLLCKVTLFIFQFNFIPRGYVAQHIGTTALGGKAQLKLIFNIFFSFKTSRAGVTPRWKSVRSPKWEWLKSKQGEPPPRGDKQKVLRFSAMFHVGMLVVPFNFHTGCCVKEPNHLLGEKQWR